MNATTLEEVVERSVEVCVRKSAIAFRDGKQSFNWITEVLLRSDLPKENAESVLLPFRNYSDAYSAEDLFNWLAQAQW